MSGMERRRFTRFGFHHEMVLRLMDSKQPVTALDISREGVGFLWQEALEVGTDIEVVLDFSDSLELPLMLTVMVCFKEKDGKFRIGSAMQSEDTDLLEELIISFNQEGDDHPS